MGLVLLLTRLTGQVGKMLGEKWKALNDKQRTPYEEKAKADKQRYENEKASYIVIHVSHDPHQGEPKTNASFRLGMTMKKSRGLSLPHSCYTRKPVNRLQRRVRRRIAQDTFTLCFTCLTGSDWGVSARTIS